MASDPYIAIFLNRLGKNPLLTAARERELSSVIQSKRPLGCDSGSLPPVSGWGCDTAVSEFTNANLCLVAHNAKRYQSVDYTFFDFFQEGVIGLLDAIARYDGTKGYRFSTYATFFIRRSMSRLLCKGLITVPIGYHVAMQRRKRLYGALYVALGRPPSDIELMKKCLVDGVFDSERSYKNSVQVLPRLVSGDAMLRDSDEHTIFDTIAADCGEDELCISAVSAAIRDALDDLPPLTRDVMCLNFGIGVERITPRQIAQKIDVEKSVVKTLKIKGLRRLRRPQTLAMLNGVR